MGQGNNVHITLTNGIYNFHILRKRGFPHELQASSRVGQGTHDRRSVQGEVLLPRFPANHRSARLAIHPGGSARKAGRVLLGTVRAVSLRDLKLPVSYRQLLTGYNISILFLCGWRRVVRRVCREYCIPPLVPLTAPPSPRTVDTIVY